jgi:hypothetical protein
LLARHNAGEAALSLGTDAAQSPVRDVELNGFTLRHALPNTASEKTPVDSIVLNNVTQAEVKHLQLERSRRHALVLQNTTDVTVEYVTIHNSSQQEPVVKTNAVNTQMKGVILPDSDS